MKAAHSSNASTPASHVGEYSGYRVTRHAHHARLYHIVIKPEHLRSFFSTAKHTDVQHIEYVPYMRFMLAKTLAECVGTGFQRMLHAIGRDRESGGFTLGVEGTTTDRDDYVRFGTAVGHLLGPANFDAMSGTYYARFVVQHIDTSDSYLRQAYRNLTLHTDGTFVNDATDWLLMMKFEERNALGGESRVIHLDDWEELERYSKHPLASHAFTYKSPPSKNVREAVQRRTFFDIDGKPGICFIDQFVCPETLEQASYLHDMLNSLENSAATEAIPLPVGDLIVLNNVFWMHGRAAFETNPELYRELMRQRGVFSPNP